MIRNFIFQLLKPLCNTDRRIARLLFWLNRKQYLILQGTKIGENCRIEKFMFPSEPYLIELGSYVSIGEGVQFITHDGGIWVLRNLENDQKLDFFGSIKIGNNVFIGNNVLLLPNIVIGDNVVIGAGAIVSKSIPAECVAAGIPAKIICSIDDYRHRKKEQCLRTKGLSWIDKRRVIGKKDQNLYSMPR